MSLRNLVGAAAALFLLFALVTAVTEPGGWPMLIPSSLFAAGCLVERWRYRRIFATPPVDAGWAETDERFVDPETRRLVAVYYQPATGERRYVDIEDRR